MLPYFSHNLQLCNPQPHALIQSLQSSPTTTLLGKYASYSPLKMEERFGHLLVVVFGILSCGGVYRVWEVFEKYGGVDHHVHWVGGLGCYGWVYGGVFEGAEVVGEGG